MPANKPFGDEVNSTGSALKLVNITPSDSTDMPDAVRMIYVGVGGNIVLTDTRGNTVTHMSAPTGGYIGPFSVARVLATGTTATNLIGYV